MYMRQKFAFPAACLVFGLLALSLGVSNSKDSKHASFVIGLAVVFVFYALMMIGSGDDQGAVCSRPAWLAGCRTWSSAWPRHRAADLSTAKRRGCRGRSALPTAAAMREALERRLPWRPGQPGGRSLGGCRPRGRDEARPARQRAGKASAERAAARRKSSSCFASRRVIIELVRLPRPSLLDASVGKAYLRVLTLAVAGMLGIVYIGSSSTGRTICSRDSDLQPSWRSACRPRRRGSSTACCRCRPSSAPSSPSAS